MDTQCFNLEWPLPALMPRVEIQWSCRDQLKFSLFHSVFLSTPHHPKPMSIFLLRAWIVAVLTFYLGQDFSSSRYLWVATTALYFLLIPIELWTSATVILIIPYCDLYLPSQQGLVVSQYLAMAGTQWTVIECMNESMSDSVNHLYISYTQ